MGYDAGDWRIPTLSVAPFDGTTDASLEVEAPDGTLTPATPSPGTDRGSWSAPAYQLTKGRWIERWTVTGTGAGKQRFIVQVAGDPTDPIPGAYATLADLDGVVDPIPGNAAQLLVRASRAVDRALLCAVYDPTDPAVIAALREATVEQVAGGLESGDRRGLGVAAAPSGFTIGRVTVQRPAAAAVPKVGHLYAQAFAALQAAGLTGQGPQTL